MKKFVFGLFRSTPVILLLISGCELTTPPGPPPRGKIEGNNIVLNELFTISPDKYYAYSWIELFNPTDHVIPWVDNVYPISTFALGSSGTLISTEELDADIWEVELPSTGQTYNNLNFYYTDTAFACGNGGLLQKIKRDPNGSFVRENLVSGTTRNINDCQFPANNSVGYFVGDGGEIKRSLNRGATWTAQTSGVTTALRQLAFVEFGNPPRIWTCGDSGVILRKGPGLTWPRQAVPGDKASLDFYGISMSLDSGYVVGEAGAILFTRNGGTNWSSKPSGVSSTLRSAFISQGPGVASWGRAWAVGDNGVILRTDNYGDSWTQLVSGTSAKLNRVLFADSIRGAVFGDGGTLLNTTDGGHTWRAQNSRTPENLVAANTLPLSLIVKNYYVIEMVAKRKTFFFDPITGTINFDYFTKIDTGLVVYDPQLLFDIGIAPRPKDVQAYSFIILNSDSTRFKDHVKLGPGQTQLQNVSIGYVPGAQPYPVLWDLLASGEIRLVKYYIKAFVYDLDNPIGFDRRVVEVIRYGNFVPSTLYSPPDELYPNNQPLGFIPEGYSISRYANDGGGKPADQQSTAYTFYMSADPIPGWFSQESRQ